jgi:HK97 family phage prohead protease
MDPLIWPGAKKEISMTSITDLNPEQPPEMVVTVPEQPVVLYTKFNFETVEVKELTQDGTQFGRISGYAATYDLDRVGDVIIPGAFSKTIKQYQEANRPIRMYFQHDSKELIGAFLPSAMREDAKGLYVEGDINLEVQRGKEIYALAKQGVLSDMSIGYSVLDFEVNGAVRELKEIELWEISVVSEPANPNAKITAVKSIDELKEIVTKLSDLEKVLREAGFSRSSAKWIAGLVDVKKLMSIELEEKDDDMTQVVESTLREEEEIKADADTSIETILPEPELAVVDDTVINSEPDVTDGETLDEEKDKYEELKDLSVGEPEGSVEDPNMDDDSRLQDLLTKLRNLIKEDLY